MTPCMLLFIIVVSRGDHVNRDVMYFRMSAAMFYCDAVSFGIFECCLTPYSLVFCIYLCLPFWKMSRYCHVCGILYFCLSCDAV
jgi:hypothetical protein